MIRSTFAVRLSGIACLTIGLAGAAIVSSCASEGYPSGAHIALSVIVVTVIVLFSILATTGLYRLTAQTDHHGYIRAAGIIEKVALAACIVGISALYLFPPTVSRDDGGLFGGWAFYTWVFAVQGFIYCNSSDGYCNPGFVVHWFLALEVVMFLGLTACVMIARQRTPWRRFRGMGLLLLMIIIPFAFVAAGWMVMFDVYVAATVSSATGLFIVWHYIRAICKSRRIIGDRNGRPESPVTPELTETRQDPYITILFTYFGF